MTALVRLFAGLLALAPLSVRAQPLDCLSAPYSDPAPDLAPLRTTLAELRPYLPLFPSLGAAFAARAPDLCLDPRPVTARGYLDASNNMIALSSALDPGNRLAVLIHELRHLEQLSRGYCPSIDISMQENARAMMAAEADAMAITALVAHALRQEGKPAAWDALAASPEYGDIPARFAEVLADTQDIGVATAEAFAHWYASDWRREAYYTQSCSDYLDRLDSTKQLPRYDLLPPDYLDDLCRLPDGRVYDCAEGPTGP